MYFMNLFKKKELPKSQLEIEIALIAQEDELRHNHGKYLIQNGITYHNEVKINWEQLARVKKARALLK